MRRNFARRLIRSTLAGVAMLVVVAASLTAQESAESEAATGPHLPADSMEIGAQYVDWLLDYRADSLWSRFSDNMRETFVSVGDFIDRMGELERQIGTQKRVVKQQYWMRNGKPQFWHTAEFTSIAEPIVIRLVIEPDGTISGIGFNPESQNPPVDDPHQHDDG